MKKRRQSDDDQQGGRPPSVKEKTGKVRFEARAGYYRPKSQVLAYELREAVGDMEAGDFIVPLADESAGEWYPRDEFLDAFELVETIDDYPDIKERLFGLNNKGTSN